MKDHKGDELREIGLIEQNLQSINAQKQAYAAQLLELEAAIAELGKTSESYRIVGNIIIKKDPKDIALDLGRKKEAADIRIKSFEKEEMKLMEKVKVLQKKVMSEKA